MGLACDVFQSEQIHEQGLKSYFEHWGTGWRGMKLALTRMILDVHRKIVRIISSVIHPS